MSTPAIICTTQNPAVKNCDSYLYVWFLLVHILIEISQDPRLMLIAVVFPMANGSGGRWEDLQLGGGCPRLRAGFLGMCTSFCGIRRKKWVVPTLSLLSGGESLKFWYPLENELWIDAWAFLLWMCVVHWKVCTHWSSPMLDATQLLNFHVQAVIMSPFYGLHSRSYIPFVSDWIHPGPLFFVGSILIRFAYIQIFA